MYETYIIDFRRGSYRHPHTKEASLFEDIVQERDGLFYDCSATMDAFQRYFTVNCLSDGAPWTVPTPNPSYACDWLIYAPNKAFVVKAYNVCYWADKESDHFPVTATYVIK